MSNPMTSPIDAQVEAAITAFEAGEMWTETPDTRMRAALTAAFSLAPAGTVEVKPLEWKRDDDVWSATTPWHVVWTIGPHSLAQSHPGLLELDAVGILKSSSSSIDALLKTADRTFEQLIRSALLPPQPSVDLPGRDVLETAFKLRREADERAVELWCEAHPDKSLTIPDHTDMVVWLLGLQSDEGIVPNLRWLRQRFDAPADTKERRILDYAIAAIAASAPALVSQPHPEALIRNAQALLDLDAKGVLVPHGIGGLAREIISAFIALYLHPAPHKAGADVAGLVEALTSVRKSVKNARGAIESGQVTDKDVHGTLTRVLATMSAALTSMDRRA